MIITGMEHIRVYILFLSGLPCGIPKKGSPAGLPKMLY